MRSARLVLTDTLCVLWKSVDSCLHYSWKVSSLTLVKKALHINSPSKVIFLCPPAARQSLWNLIGSSDCSWDYECVQTAKCHWDKKKLSVFQPRAFGLSTIPSFYYFLYSRSHSDVTTIHWCSQNSWEKILYKNHWNCIWFYKAN